MSRTEQIQRAAILINQTAGGGQCRKTWLKIKSEVLLQLPKDTLLIPFDGQLNLKEQLAELIKKEGVNCFISAGGDGSVHYLLNGLMDLKTQGAPALFLGAIGLGSSNDFHKPYRTMIRGIPTRISQKNIEQVDVGLVNFLTEEGEKHQCHFLINASLGVTAAANHFFNNGDTILRFFKRQWTPGAILYAAISTILSFRNYQATLIFDKRKEEIALSNLALLKNPHISGNLRYDQNISPADGQLGLNYCDNMSKLELLRLLNDLGKGRFIGPPKRHAHLVHSLQVNVDHPVPMEADGEVYVGTDFEFSLLPKAINLLDNGY